MRAYDEQSTAIRFRQLAEQRSAENTTLVWRLKNMQHTLLMLQKQVSAAPAPSVPSDRDAQACTSSAATHVLRAHVMVPCELSCMQKSAISFCLPLFLAGLLCATKVVLLSSVQFD